MRKFHHVLMDFLVFILISYLGGAEAEIQISPPETGKSVEKYVNDTYIVTCEQKEVSAAQLSWRGPGNTIANTKGRVHVEKIQGALALMFERIDKKDKGNYTCTSIVDGSKQQAYFTLVVIRPISFLNTPRVQSASEKSDALLRCEADGDPTPQVTWQVKGKAPEGSRYRKEQKGLFIKNVSLEDAGEYECRAFQISEITNMETLKITLKVLHKPIWKTSNPEQKDTAYGYLGGIVNLTCEAIADPEASFTWKRLNKAIKPQHYNATIITEPNRSVLQLPISNMSIYGEYGCEARNNLGHISRIIELKRGEKPEAPEQVNVRTSTVNTISLEIPSEGQSGYNEIIGYRVVFVKKLPGIEYTWDAPDYQDFDKSDEYVVQDLLENTTYVLRVASRNAAGLSDYSATEVTVRTRKTDEVEIDGAQRHTATCIIIMASIHVFLRIH